MPANDLSITIRELRKEENEAVVQLIRTGLLGSIRLFRRQFSLDPKVVVFVGVLLGISLFFRLFYITLIVLISFAFFVYQSPYITLGDYFRGCVDYADMRSHYQKDGYQLLVAVVDTRIVGSVAITRIDSASANLCRMSVDKDFRRLGIGRRLMQRIEEYCRSYGYKRVQLSTSNVHIPAITLYEGYGYRRFKTEFIPLFKAFPITGRTLVYLEKVL